MDMSMTTPSNSTNSTSDSSMDSMGMGNGCKISMLWNWNVLDTCFIAESWHITSRGMFAGSCIGVILLVILLEFLRRAAKEYDAFIVEQYSRALGPTTTNSTVPSSVSSSDGNIAAGASKGPVAGGAALPARVDAARMRFRPSVMQQAVRALLHTCAFAVAYFVMLLAMYYNGYFIICIFIGAYIGYFVFGWESFNVGKGGEDRMQENATVCCG